MPYVSVQLDDYEVLPEVSDKGLIEEVNSRLEGKRGDRFRARLIEEIALVREITTDPEDLRIAFYSRDANTFEAVLARLFEEPSKTVGLTKDPICERPEVVQ